MRQKVTCPETAHLEEIEFDEDPIDGKILGVRGCSRFHPADAVDCELLCMHRLNARLQSPRVKSSEKPEDEEHRNTEHRNGAPAVGEAQ